MRRWAVIVAAGAMAGAMTPVPVGAATLIQAKPAVVAGNVWFLRNSLTSGFADTSFVYGTSKQAGFPLMGDWNGDGERTPGLVYGNRWFLRNSNSSGVANVQFIYGFDGGIPVAGDWDGDGLDTPGMVLQILPTPQASVVPSVTVSCTGGGGSKWFLRNSNSSGIADKTLTYNCPGSFLSGDWDGDGDDTPMVRSLGTNFWLVNNDLDNTFDAVFQYGTASDFPIVGDWDGDGDDTPGVVQGNIWALRNSNTSGVADFSFAYGSSKHYPLVWGST